MSRYNMNNIDPFGFGRREQSSEPSNINGSTDFNIQGLNDGPAGDQGIMGGEPIRQYLMPLLGQINSQIQQQAQQEMKQKIPAYVQQVQQVTDQTFPDLSLSGGGFGGIGNLFGQPFMSGGQGGIGGIFGGGMKQFQGGLDPISQNQVSNTIESSPNQNPSPFGTSSFFR